MGGTTMTGFHVESKEDLVDLTYGVWYNRIMTTGIELGVFDAVGETSRATEELARELDLDPGNGYRLFRALASMGLLKEGQNRQFSISPYGELLQTDHSESMRGLALLNKEADMAAKHLPDIVQEGGGTWTQREFDMALFEVHEEDPEFAKMFNDAMDSYSKLHLLGSSRCSPRKTSKMPPISVISLGVAVI